MRHTGSSTSTALRRRGAVLPALLLAAAAGGPIARAADEQKIIGIIEKVEQGGIVVDASTVVLAEKGKVRGEVRDLAKAEVGFWAEAHGRFMKRGSFEADSVKIERDAPGSHFSERVTESSLKESKKLDASDKIYHDPRVTEYVRMVADPLVPDYARRDHAFSFEVIRDPTLNAFAMPSGAVYVHTGLLARLDNEAQLGIVLGHEISHVTQRHGQRQYKTNMAAFIPAQIVGIAVGINFQRNNDNPLYQAMVGLGLQLGLSAAVSGYGRTLEDQADRVGLRYAVSAGYEPAEGPKIWVIFNDVYGDEGKVENFFYGNHSTNEVRKENLESEIQRHYSREEGEGAAPAGGGEAVPAGHLVNEEVYQRTMLDLTRDNAIDDFNLKRYRLASKGFERVLTLRPGDAVAHHYMGRIILATEKGEGAADRALAEYLKAVSFDPAYPDVHRDLGLLYEAMSRPADARAHLQRYLDLAPADAKDRKDVEKELLRLE
jgi:beta-barrel assembly-enhancing protease